MKTASCLPLCLTAACLVCACEASDPWPNSRRYDAGQTAIVYQAPPEAAESIEAAWFPASILQLSQNTFIYAARGTRKIIHLDAGTQTQTVLFDLSAFEKDISPTRSYSTPWGETLIRANTNWIILASASQPIVWMNIHTGEVVLTGRIHPQNALIPADGLMASDIDFELFSGIGRVKNGFVLAFGNQIFTIDWENARPEDLLSTPMKKLAGTLDPVADAEPSDAFNTLLQMSEFTHFAEFKDWILFWEKHRLRAVKKGRIFTVTGDGFLTPGGSLDELFAHELPQNPPIAAMDNVFFTPYWDDLKTLLRIEITDIDEETGHAEGYQSTFRPEAGTMDTIVSGMTDLVTVDTIAGTFWKIDPKTETASRIFGPETALDRFTSLSHDPNTPYEPHSILAPLSISPIHDGANLVLLSPTIERLNLLNPESGNQSVILQASFTSMASDRKDRIWYTENDNTLNQLLIHENGQIESSYIPAFFSYANPMGIPCDHKQFRLPESPDIQTFGRHLLIHLPNEMQILDYDTAADEITALHSGGWLSPSTSKPDYFQAAFPVFLTTLWKSSNLFEAAILEDDGHQYLTVVNLTSGTISVAGRDIETGHGLVISGKGTQSIAGGQPLEDTELTDIRTIAIAGEKVVVATRDQLFETSENGMWQALDDDDGCRELPNSDLIDLQIQVQGNNRLYLAKTVHGFAACSSTNQSFAGTQIGSKWTQIDDVITAASCDGYSRTAYLTNRQICSQEFGKSKPDCTPIPAGFDIGQLACGAGQIFFVDRAEHPTIYKTSLKSPQKPELLTGNGPALPDKSPIGETNIGENIGAMATDGIPNLYFWMKDTCTVWRFPAFQSIKWTDKTEITRLITHDFLCDGAAFAVSFDSTVYFARDRFVYRVKTGDRIDLIAELPGPVIELTAIGYGLAIMTPDGIYTWEKDILSHRAPNPIELNGQKIDYATPGGTHPRMAQKPHTNAVLVPVFKGDMLVQIAL